MPDDPTPRLTEADLGALLRQILGAAGVSRERAAEAAGVSHDTIDRIVRGESVPRVRVFALLLEVAGYQLIVTHRSSAVDQGQPIP